MKNTISLLLLLIFALLFLVSVLLYSYLNLKQQLALFYSQPQINYEAKKDIVHILDLLITKILLSKEPIELNEKIFIDNQIKSLNNQEIYSKWVDFLNSSSEEEAQLRFKILLKTLVDKLK